MKRERAFSKGALMGADIVERLQLKRMAGRRARGDRAAKAGAKISMNAILGMGLWLLLWLGYNTSWGYVVSPRFPANTTELIHGVRAFFPMLAGWLAALLIMSRPNRAVACVAGPLGLMLVYAVTGLVSTAAFLDEPVDGLYYGANYLAIVLVLLAIVSVDDPLPDLRHLLNLTWFVGSLLTLGLLGAIPFLGSAQTITEGSGAMGVRAYTGVGEVMGMAGSRNTGFARYAAISALVAFPWLWKKCSRTARVIAAVLFGASIYALIIANGRTEILAFILSAFVILTAERAKRTLFLIVGAGAAVLLAFVGFFGGFFMYFTRTGHVDATLTGRTVTWEQGWRVFLTSPLVGLGFQADRVYLGTHMHNAFLHVLFQAGLLGGGAILLAIGLTWYYLIKYFFINRPDDPSLIPPEIPAVFLFVTISSLTESTFAYFSAAWLLSAPIVAYVMALDRRQRRLSFKTYQDLQAQNAKGKRRRANPSLDMRPAPTGQPIPR